MALLVSSLVVTAIACFIKIISASSVGVEPYHTLSSSDLPPANSAAARPKPLSGFVTSPDWHGGYKDPADLAFPSTLEFYYIGLSDVMEGMESFPGFDGVVEPRIAASASRGRHAILRFYIDYPRPSDETYVSKTPQFLIDKGLAMTPWWSDDLNQGGLSPDYSDETFIQAMESFIRAFGARYNGDTRLGYVQLGLLGFWGEHHTWTGDPATNSWIPESTRMRIIDAYDAAFDTTIVQARSIHWYAVGRAGFGLHDDSFAFSTLDEGIYVDGNGSPVAMGWFFWSQVVAANATDFYQLGAMGGEIRLELQSTVFHSDYPAGTPYHQDFAMCVHTTHATYMLNHHAFATGYRKRKTLDTAIEASDDMGYAFRVTEVAAHEGSKGDNVDISITVIQDGVAPFYYPLDLRLECTSEVATSEQKKKKRNKYLPVQATVTGVESGLISKGDTATFVFTSIPATSSCLSAMVLSLYSKYALVGVPIKFSQGVTDGTSLTISVPLPWEA